MSITVRSFTFVPFVGKKRPNADCLTIRLIQKLYLNKFNLLIKNMMEFQTNWSRRKFLAAMSVAGAGTMMLNPMAAWAFDDIDPRVAKIVADTIGIDTHNHIDVPLTAGDVPGPNIDLTGEM